MQLDGEGSDGKSDDKPDPLLLAKAVWTIGVKAQPKHRPPVPGPFKTWLGKKMVSRHLRLASADYGDFQDVEGDLADGAPLCLRYLTDDVLDGEKFTGTPSSLQYNLMEDRLSECLGGMMSSLRDAGYNWKWTIEEIEKVEVQRMFMIVGASRTGTTHRGPTGILGAFGQQFVLAKEQTERFLSKESGVRGRMEVLQELLVSDSVLVGDVVLHVSQRSNLECEAGACNNKRLHPGRKTSVQHVLRLEMALSHDRNEDVPLVRPSSWQIADWNWLCRGNHPALPAGVSAPW